MEGSNGVHTPEPLVPIAQEAEWTQGSVWAIEEIAEWKTNSEH
jgi:hypothetical protein